MSRFHSSRKEERSRTDALTARRRPRGSRLAAVWLPHVQLGLQRGWRRRPSPRLPSRPREGLAGLEVSVRIPEGRGAGAELDLRLFRVCPVLRSNVGSRQFGDLSALQGPAGWATLWAGRTVVCQRPALGGGGGQGPGPRPRCACLDSLHPRISHRPDCDPGTSPRHSEIRAYLETSLRPQWRGGRRVLWTHGAGPADGCCSVRLTCCGRLRTPRPNVAGSPAS